MLYSMCFGVERARKMAMIRGMFWLSKPFMGRQNIWVTFDKLYKGGDCGEYFYKYMCTRPETGVVPVYVINGKTADYARLCQENYKPSAKGTLRQILQFLHAKMIFGTHVNVGGLCGFERKRSRYIQDLPRYSCACIQHGLSVQDLSQTANRMYDNNVKYYCASRYEIENLRQKEYGYADKDLVLTGIPRYDGLVSDDQKQILITPTWRKNLALLPEIGSMRPYNPAFKESAYFQIYDQLLKDKRLIETAHRTGYRLIYLLHPVFSSQRKDFEEREGVTILTAGEISYEQLLTESSVMVTDYSGVQFDFAYMRKPIVYYHRSEIPPHYIEGGFFYNTQGFGEICTTQEELVDTLCGYMENECSLKPLYQERQDDFFAFSDHENCKRIFEDALAYQKGRMDI